MRKSLTKRERIHCEKDIRRLFVKSSKICTKREAPLSFRTEGLQLRAAPNSAGVHRLFLSPIKKSGRAVHRNYLKRIFREFFRQEKAFLSQNLQTNVGYDWAFVIYPSSEKQTPISRTAEYSSRKHQYKTLLTQAYEAFGKIPPRTAPIGRK